MPESVHLAKITSGGVVDALACVMGEESPLIAWDRRVGRIKVNGVPLAEQYARFKRQDDVIFHKQTHEAKMGADIVAGVGLDQDLLNITTRDSPDLVLHFVDGDVHADFTRACVDLDEANDEAVRAVNRRLRTELKANPLTNWDGDPISPHLTIRVRPAGLLDRNQLYGEVLNWIRESSHGFAVPGQLLSGLGADLDWVPHAFRGDENVIVQFLESRDLTSLVATVQKRIAEKTDRYPQRPLWLLISISESWANRIEGGAYQEFLSAAGCGSLTFDLGDFDRVAVGVRGQSVWLSRPAAQSRRDALSEGRPHIERPFWKT